MPTSNSPIAINPNVLSCRLCSESFQDVVHFQMHTIANHTNLLNESRTASSSPSNIVSRQSTDDQTRSACTLCQVDFEDAEAYGHHMSQHFSSTNAIYFCDKCALTFQLAEQFRRHFAMHHTDVLYRCAVCLKVFTKRHIYEEHTAEHLTTISIFNCVICLRNFDKYSTLVEHLSLAHLDFGLSGQRAEGMLGAQNCFGATEDGVSMNAAARYLAERAWRLASESRGSAAVASATVDAVSAAPIVDDRLFQAPVTSPHAAQLSVKGLKCSVCDEQFADELSLDEHRLVNHCMVPHGDLCAICRQKLSNVEEFVAHSLAHAEKAFGALSCVVCRQTIHGEPQIRMHAQYHLRVERPPHRGVATQAAADSRSPTAVGTSPINDSDGDDHVCDKCGEKFDRFDDFRTHSAEKHTRSSSGAAQSEPSRLATKQTYPPKFYHCVKCSLRFNSMARSAAHQRLHHLKRAQFKCKICDDKFTSEDFLKAHIKIHEMSITQFVASAAATNEAS